jgi:hypothetical protein
MIPMGIRAASCRQQAGASPFLGALPFPAINNL